MGPIIFDGKINGKTFFKFVNRIDFLKALNLKRSPKVIDSSHIDIVPR